VLDKIAKLGRIGQDSIRFPVRKNEKTAGSRLKDREIVRQFAFCRAFAHETHRNSGLNRCVSMASRLLVDPKTSYGACRLQGARR